MRESYTEKKGHRDYDSRQRSDSPRVFCPAVDINAEHTFLPTHPVSPSSVKQKKSVNFHCHIQHLSICCMLRSITLCHFTLHHLKTIVEQILIPTHLHLLLL